MRFMLGWMGGGGLIKCGEEVYGVFVKSALLCSMCI